MRSPEFSAYIQPARQYPELWRLPVAIAMMLFISMGWFAIMIVVLYPIIGPINYFGWLAGLRTLDQAPQTLFLLFSFGGTCLGTLIATAALHGRSPASLLGPWGETMRSFSITVAVLVPVYAALIALTWQLDPALPNLETDAWLRLLPYAVPLILLQTSTEELLFRGYLQQQLAVRFAARWVWMGLPALLFTALHWNPAAGHNIWFIMLSIGAFALIAADLTERSGSLGAAIGLHFVNNLAALTVISVSGTITGLALFVTPYSIDDLSTVPLSSAFNLVLLFVVWRLLRVIIVR